MRRRWSLILPLVGLMLFSVVSLSSLHLQRDFRKNSRYFYWGAMRLDPDPQNKRPRVQSMACGPEEVCWDPEFIWIEQGWDEKVLVLSAVPAFAAGDVLVRLFGWLGISQVLTFFVAMPPMIALWFYFLGWLVDRRRSRKVAAAKLATGN